MSRENKVDVLPLTGDYAHVSGEISSGTRIAARIKIANQSGDVVLDVDGESVEFRGLNCETPIVLSDDSFGRPVMDYSDDRENFITDQQIAFETLRGIGIDLRGLNSSEIAYVLTNIVSGCINNFGYFDPEIVANSIDGYRRMERGRWQYPQFSNGLREREPVGEIQLHPANQLMGALRRRGFKFVSPQEGAVRQIEETVNGKTLRVTNVPTFGGRATGPYRIINEIKVANRGRGQFLSFDSCAFSAEKGVNATLNGQLQYENGDYEHPSYGWLKLTGAKTSVSNPDLQTVLSFKRVGAKYSITIATLDGKLGEHTHTEDGDFYRTVNLPEEIATTLEKLGINMRECSVYTLVNSITTRIQSIGKNELENLINITNVETTEKLPNLVAAD